jgi:hypothetical protein
MPEPANMQGHPEESACTYQFGFRAYFSPSWTASQPDGGRGFRVIVDDEGGAQVIV